MKNKNIDFEDFNWQLSIANEELSDPKVWLNKARMFAYATNFLIKDHLTYLQTNIWPEDKQYLFKIFEPFLFNMAVTIELYLKAYLIFEGVTPLKIEKYKHDIKRLRQDCLSYGDIRFDKGILPYITDNYGKVLMSKGGIKYPGRKTPPAIFPDYATVLDELDVIVSEKANLFQTNNKS